MTETINFKEAKVTTSARNFLKEIGISVPDYIGTRFVEDKTTFRRYVYQGVQFYFYDRSSLRTVYRLTRSNNGQVLKAKVEETLNKVKALYEEAAKHMKAKDEREAARQNARELAVARWQELGINEHPWLFDAREDFYLKAEVLSTGEARLIVEHLTVDQVKQILDYLREKSPKKDYSKAS